MFRVAVSVLSAVETAVLVKPQQTQLRNHNGGSSQQKTIITKIPLSFLHIHIYLVTEVSDDVADDVSHDVSKPFLTTNEEGIQVDMHQLSLRR